MPKFSGTKKRPVRANQRAAVASSGVVAPTHEGGEGFARTPEGELFLLAITNMIGEETFYETSFERDKRFIELIHEVAQTNPEFIAGADPANGKIGLGEYLRKTMHMRSASVVMAAEYVAGGGPEGRSLVARSLQRADEPAEILGYWLAEHGRRLPAAVKRGVADAVVRLYNEHSALRYDGRSRSIRMADVIELVHPQPKDQAQSDLFRYLLDKRHHDDASLREWILRDDHRLETIRAATELELVSDDQRREVIRSDPDALRRAGFSWERLSGWLPGGMDAEAWEAVIPTMGYMALLRNLRNFDEAGVSKKVVKQVVAKIEDPDEVRRSRQFPYRFWSAYKFAPSVTWSGALESALSTSVENIPELPGRTLVLIDTSGSMQSPLSNRSRVQRFEVAALFAAAQAKRAANADVVIFGTDHAPLPVKKGHSVLRYIESVGKAIGSVGHGTFLYTALLANYDGHDRVVVFTDEQAHDSVADPRALAAVPLIYTFNLGGYRVGAFDAGQKGRYTFGGFTDAAFTAMRVLEEGRDADWPF
ncbi:MAG: TROVE domain-containing protein [Actinomycetota bacterium]|nr:TROVE domain-containing protein [Actinomycetota bacterium]